jgi:hypothetical protein
LLLLLHPHLPLSPQLLLPSPPALLVIVLVLQVLSSPLPGCSLCKWSANRWGVREKEGGIFGEQKKLYI